jgi:predicted DNA binding CopG/RHH family protein
MVRRSRTTSISLDEGLIEKLRVKGERRGLGYQTMLKLIVSEHVDDY